MSSHQDWKEVTWIKPSKNKTIKPKISTKQAQLNKIERNVDEGNLTHKKISHELRLKIQRGRLEKKLTQKKLAHKLNVPVSTIQKYETGKIIPQGVFLSKLKRILQIK